MEEFGVVEDKRYTLFEPKCKYLILAQTDIS